MRNGAPIRMVVVSGRRLLRDAFRALLDSWSGAALVGQADHLDALADLCRLCRPDAALVDFDELTISLVERLCQTRTDIPATELMLSYAKAAPPALTAAQLAGFPVLTASAGSTDALAAIGRRFRSDHRNRPNGKALTQAELRLMSLLCSGYSVPEMAGMLRLSPYTVENRKRRLYVKLGVGSSSHAVARVASLGLIDPPQPATTARPEESGRAPLVVVAGQPGPSLDAVLLALIADRLPFVHLRRGSAAKPQDHWSQWQRGSMLAVLVDPEPADWQIPAGLAAWPVAVLTRSDPDDSAAALTRGARALVRAGDVVDHLTAVLAVVSRGYLAVAAPTHAGSMGWPALAHSGERADPPALTTRERQILTEISAGHTVPQTARALGIAPKTVENTLARLYRKLGVHNRAGALSVAYQLGLLESPSASARP